MDEVENKSCEEKCPGDKIVQCLKKACEQVSLKGINKKKKFEEEISDRIVDKLKDSECNKYDWLREFPVSVPRCLLDNAINNKIEYVFFKEKLTNEGEVASVDCKKNIQKTPATCSSRVDIMCTNSSLSTITFNSNGDSYSSIASVQNDNGEIKNLKCTIEVKQTFPYHNDIDVITLETNGLMLGQVKPNPNPNPNPNLKQKQKFKYLDEHMWFVEYELRSDISKRYNIDVLRGIPFIWILAVTNTVPGDKMQAIYHARYSSNQKDFDPNQYKQYVDCINALNRDYIADLFQYYFGENCWCKFTNDCENITFYLGYAPKLGDLGNKIENDKESFCKKLFQENSQI